MIHKKKLKIFILTTSFFYIACSPNNGIGVATISENSLGNNEKEVLTEEDYPIILTNCLNDKGYDMQTPFDIEDLKSTIDQMASKDKGKEERSSIMKDVEDCIQENELWPDRQSENPEEMARRFDSNLKLAQCLRDKGLNVPDPTQDNPKLNLSEVDEKREKVKEYLEECDDENGTFQKGS